MKKGKYSSRLAGSAILLSIGLSSPVLAQELPGTDNERDGSYLDLGLGIIDVNDVFIYDDSTDPGLTLFFNGRYQKYGFFVEAPRGSGDQRTTVLSLGYNFFNTPNWSFDLQLAMNHRDLEHEFNVDGEELISRRISKAEWGVRAQGTIGQSDLQFVVAKASGSGGVYASAWYTRNFQYRNWHLYSSVGGQYRNESAVNYFYGVSETMADRLAMDAVPAYQGKAGIEFSAQVGTSYPVSEDWVFESYLRTTILPGGISDSPLVSEDSITEAAVLVKYVF